MAKKKKAPRKGPRQAHQPRMHRRLVPSPASSSITSAVDAMTERLDMMLPEIIARVAAVEHLLVDKQLCSHNDLVRSRQFVDRQESF